MVTFFGRTREWPEPERYEPLNYFLSNCYWYVDIENENRILHWTRCIVQEAYDSMDVEDDEVLPNFEPASLGLAVIKLWSRLFLKNTQWPFINILGESLKQYLAMIQSGWKRAIHLVGLSFPNILSWLSHGGKVLVRWQIFRTSDSRWSLQNQSMLTSVIQANSRPWLCIAIPSLTAGQALASTRAPKAASLTLKVTWKLPNSEKKELPCVIC